MNYLYGDSTPSTLTSNFLELLRDAIDFSVFALEADARMKQGRARMQAAREEAKAETERLERFLGVVAKGIEAGEKGAPDSPTAECAARLVQAVEEARRATRAAIEARLAAESEQIEADEIATRKGCAKALGAMLTPNEVPDSKVETRIALTTSGRYEAARTGTSAFGLAWSFEIAVDDASLFAAPVRVERLAPHLEIRAPQLSGWLSKEVKIRPQKLERLFVVEVADEGRVVSVKLRGEGAATETGFDVELYPASGAVRIARVGPAGDESVGDFDVAQEDQAPLAQLAEKLRAALAELSPKKLVAATVEGEPFETQPSFVGFVQRLVTMMTPIVRDISDHSLTKNELVIRRLLSNDRREEIFVAKSTLREKYASLPDEARGLFLPLGLEPAPKRVATAEYPALSAPKEIIRAELPRSKPPPPLPRPGSRPVDLPRISTMPIELSDIEIVEGASKPPPPEAPAAEPAPAAASAPVPEPPPAPAPAAAVPSPPPSSATEIENRALAAALKKIAMLTRNGRVDDAYEEYVTLFSSAAFADFRPDDQRHALGRLVLTKAKPPKAAEVLTRAHKAALSRVNALVAALDHPADYELLGATQLALGDTNAARAAFTTGLAREKARDAGSKLAASLASRIAALDAPSPSAPAK